MAIRALISACKEASRASKSVIVCAESINRACSAVEHTCSMLDSQLKKVEEIESASASVFSSLGSEAGLLTKRLSDLPQNASRTLQEAIESITNLQEPSSKDIICGAYIDIGTAIPGKRVGTRWEAEGGDSEGCSFSFSRSNLFRAGEYVAVPRSNGLFTWGVIELKDDMVSSSVSVSEDESPALSCDWPPPPAEKKQINSIRAVREKLVDALRPRLEILQQALRRFSFDVDLTDEDLNEIEYRVVVELDTNNWTSKMVKAGLLGKRV